MKNRSGRSSKIKNMRESLHTYQVTFASNEAVQKPPYEYQSKHEGTCLNSAVYSNMRATYLFVLEEEAQLPELWREGLNHDHMR